MPGLHARIRSGPRGEEIRGAFESFRISLRPRWQEMSDGRRTSLARGPDLLEVAVHFPEGEGIGAARRALQNLAEKDVEVELAPGFSFRGWIIHVAWEERVSKEGASAGAVATLVLEGREVD